MSDHDLIIKIHTIVERLVTDVQELNDNTVSRISDLEVNKIDKIDYLEDLKKYDICVKELSDRITKNEITIARIMTWGSALLLILGVIEVVLSNFKFTF